MAEDKNLTQLIINEMTKAQYEALPQINEDEIYVLTDVDTTIHTDNNTLQGDGSIENPIGLSDTIISTLNNKQDKLTAGTNITIENNIISSIAQESFFRGRFTEWTSVPTSSANYTADFHGNTTPSYNDYIVVEDSSLYIPQDFLSDPNNVMIRNLHSAGVLYTIEVVIQDQIRRVYYQECTNGEYAQINDWLSVTYVGGAPGVWYIKTNKEFYINNVFTPTANKLLLLKTNTPYETNFYLSETPGVAPVPIYGSWRFVYHGNWADDNILGWKPEYQIEDTLPIATETQAGINKTYTAGTNITIKNNVISSTAQESFFRGRYENWDTVPTNGQSYPNDIDGNHIPSNTDYIIIEDSSTVPGGQVDMQMTMETDRYSTHPTQKLETVVNGITYNGVGIFDDGNIEVFCNTDGGNYTVNWKTLKNSVEYQGKTYEAGSVFFKVIIKPENNITQNAKLSLGNPYTGSWRFSYRGAWDLDNRNGWKAEYQIEDVLPIATEAQSGIVKLYTTSGSNEDGAMTQKAVGDAISAHNTATNAHSDIRGVAGGLATLDNNAKVPMSQINDALIGNVSYQGLWNAETNTPFLVDPTGGLPAGYKALGYINFSLESYINTGVIIEETDETVEYDIKMTPSRTSCFPFGASGSNAGENNTGSLFFNSGTIEYFAGKTRNIRLGEVITGKDYLINIKLDQTTQTVTVIENDLRVTQSYAGSIIAPVPIILGGLYYGTASSPIRNFNYAGKIHYFIIRKNGVTVKQYQPAQRISDGTYGFYEHVSGEFVVSSGASFTSGGGEIEIPKGYYYITTVAGDRFGLHFDVGDWIISAGGYWSKVDNTDAVVSVNGRTGNVVVTAEDLDLSNYVQKTDIANHKQAGLLLGVGSGFRANIYGMPQCDSLTTVSYPGVDNSYFISKGSIENLKDDIVKRAITANSITLTEEEQTAAKTWLGVTDADLSNYVQKTDYASSSQAGLIRGYNANGFGFVPDTGYPYCETKSLASYNTAGGNLFVGKGTLETIKYSYVRDGIANNTYSLSNTEKEKVRNWIGAGVPTVFETMPDLYASAGKTYQYVGETTEELTSGYFYKSVSQGLSYIASDSNLTFDFDLFWSELESAGITLETLQMTEMDKERGGFSIIGTVESETNYRVENINGIPLDVLLTQSIQSTSEYVGANNRWYYKPMETFAWERVDVQPALTKEEADATYLQLTGGTITGDLVIKNDSSNTVEPILTLSHGSEDIVISKIRYGKTLDFNNTTLTGLANVSPTQSKGELGTAGAYWVKAYIRNLNAGAPSGKDLLVPSKAGTLATLDDIPAATQFEALPVISENNVGDIVQYTGETTNDYTQGHFYKSIKTTTENIAGSGYTFNMETRIVVNVISDQFLSNNPIFADPSIANAPYPAWRADYNGAGFWNVWTQTPNILISETELTNVWGVSIVDENGLPYTPAAGDSITVTRQEEINYHWKEINFSEDCLSLDGGTMTGTLNVPELNVATDEGTLNLSVAAGVATITANNGLDIASQTKFDTAPTTDDNTTWADASEVSLVRKAQVTTAITDVKDDINDLQTQVNTRTRVIIRRWE